MQILIFVEDPGAANLVLGLPIALEQAGHQVTLLAAGKAVAYLQARGERHQAVSPGANAEQVLQAYAPALVLAGTAENKDTLGLALVEATRAQRIPSVGLVDALANAQHRFRGRRVEPLAYAPDWLFVPDAWTADAYIALGYPRCQIIECGHPHYDVVRAERQQLEEEGQQVIRQRLLPGFAADRPVLVFIAESSTGFNPAQFQYSEDYTLVGTSGRTSRTEIVLEELLRACGHIQPRPYLVLRLHPKNQPEEFVAYRAEIDALSSGGHPLDLVWAADLVVGMTSMLLLEAALLGRPTLSIVPRALEANWLPSIRMGATPVASTRPAIEETLGALLMNWQQGNAPAPPDLLEGAQARMVAAVGHLLQNQQMA